MTAILRELHHQIARRYAEQAGKSLWQIYRIEPEICQPSPELLEFAYGERRAIAATLHETSARLGLIRRCCEMTEAFSQQKNQFISFSVHDHQLLAQIYSRFLAGMTLTLCSAQSPKQLEGLFLQILRQHFLALRNFTARFLVSDTAVPLHDQFIFKEPVCSEYSGALQLQIFGIDEKKLKEPILDIGCGRHGELVKHLRQKGYEAFGVDRDCPASGFSACVDWLELDLEPDSWGSILSHMAFSNHFRFHHLYSQGQPERYAAKFMHILAALQRGGSFYYAPGLPFIETFLSDRQFHLRRTPIACDSLQNVPAGSSQQFSIEAPLESVQIEKIA